MYTNSKIAKLRRRSTLHHFVAGPLTRNSKQKPGRPDLRIHIEQLANPSGEAAPAADLITATPDLAEWTGKEDTAAQTDAQTLLTLLTLLTQHEY